jgi:hypothetical protein
MHVDRVAHRLRQGEERAGRNKDSVDRIMRHAVIDDIEEAAVSQAAPISATTRSVAAASPRPRPATLIIGMYEKSLASAAIDRLRSFS